MTPTWCDLKVWISCKRRRVRISLTAPYRDITFREGGRLVEVPLVQAVMRATGMKALRGHAPSAKHFMDLVKLVEEKQAEQRKIEALKDQVITYRRLDYDEDPDE